ncbi:MAG: RNA polymerase sigma factor [Bdellovibrio sp.]|nr:MAG: RNA polymerase sigma factor [Bdellovibrio sp.]
MSSSGSKSFSGEQFLKKLHQRDSELLKDLIHHYTPVLTRAAFGMGLSSQDVEEVVQQVWSVLVDVAPRFEGRSHIRTFLFGILYNKVFEWRRSLKKEGQSDPIESVMEDRFDEQGTWKEPPCDPEEFLLKAEVMELIEKCYEKLSGSQKMAFYLKEIEGAPSSEICKILEVSVTHLGVLMFRARNKLRECIERASKE